MKRFFTMKTMAVIVACFTLFAVFSSCQKKSDEKQITDFRFKVPFAIGVIDENAKTVTVNVPEDTDVTALVPAITVSASATVNPASGVAQDFTNPVNYTVTAEDGTTAVYKVTVTGGSGGEKKPQQLYSPITKDTVLEDLGLEYDYFFDEGTTLLKIDNNAILTIKPGVTIKFMQTGGGISIQSGCKIVAEGTEEKPIEFIGNSTAIGSWAYINIASNKDNSFKYCNFIGGGSVWNYGVVNNITADSKVFMENCHINGSKGAGFYTEASTNTSTIKETIIEKCEGGHYSGIYMNTESATLSLTNVTIKDNKDYGINFNKAGTITHEGVNGKFSNNLKGNVRLANGEILAELP